MKKLISILSVAALVLCSSCNDWLNVTPQGQVEAEDLYETTKGCNSAIGGVYYTLSGSSLFGQTLSYGLIDVLAQYWDLSTNTSHFYYPAANYEYVGQNVAGIFRNVWSQLYYAIAQCNAFIHYSEPNQASIDNYGLLLGEVYGLRALAHMELFEIYGPVIQTTADLQKKAVAYRTDYDNVSRQFDTAETVLQKAGEDLDRALELLADDPIRDPEVGRESDLNTSVIDYQDVLNFRGARMNYFCALGLKARLEMLRKNTTEAYRIATRIIDESKDILSLVNTNNIASNNESSIWNYSTEMLGSFYTNNLYTMTDTYFGMGGRMSQTSTTGIFINDSRYGNLVDYVYGRQPDGSGQDIRLLWFSTGNMQETGCYDFMKVKEAKARVNMPSAYFPEIPIMRLSEVYYIACEAQIGTDNTLALQYLNDVRSTRRLEPLEGSYSDGELLEFLVREARKDFIGDGRMFFMYKRLFYDIYTSTGRTVTANENIFVIPIPDDEYEFAGMDKSARN